MHSFRVKSISFGKDDLGHPVGTHSMHWDDCSKYVANETLQMFLNSVVSHSYKKCWDRNKGPKRPMGAIPTQAASRYGACPYRVHATIKVF